MACHRRLASGPSGSGCQFLKPGQHAFPIPPRIRKSRKSWPGCPRCASCRACSAWSWRGAAQLPAAPSGGGIPPGRGRTRWGRHPPPSGCPDGCNGRRRCPPRPWPSPCRRSAGTAVQAPNRRPAAAAAAGPRLRQLRPLPRCERAGLLQDVLPGREVGAVHRESGDDLCDGVRGLPGVGPRPGGNGSGRNQPCQPEDFGVQDAVGDPRVWCRGSSPRSRRVLRRGACRRAASRACCGLGVDEEPVHVRQRVVAGGPLALEGRRQLLPRLQDLLDQQVAAAGGFA